MLKKGKTV